LPDIDYLGFVAVGKKTPLLVRADDDDDRDVIRDRHGSEGVIFTTAADMPSLEALLEAHEVGFAFLQTPSPLADSPVVASPSVHLSWRDDARRRLSHALDDRERGDAIFHEDYAFIPALATDAVDGFLDRAFQLLDNSETTEDQWNDLLVEASRDVAALDPVTPATDEETEPSSTGPAPLFSTADLVLTRHRGALGGPPPLVRSR
jgi:hypothetical protein